MSNSFSNERIERQVFDKLVDRYNDLIKGVKLYGYPLPKNSYSPSVTASKPMIDYQLVYQEDLKYEKSDMQPRLYSLQTLQRAINYLENRYSYNCNCYSLPMMCQTCQHQCSTDSGSETGQCSCQYDKLKPVCQTYACQTLKCQTISSIKSCEKCESCESCQYYDTDVPHCQSCQDISCQTLACEALKNQCTCQTCEGQCTCQTCQTIGYYDSCQSQCKV